jgi:hypothetical protein
MKIKLLIFTLLVSGCATGDYTRDDRAGEYVESYIKYLSTNNTRDKKAAQRKWDTYIKHNEN